MEPMDVVQAWDRSLRDGEWDVARSLLTEDATYTSEMPDAEIDCSSPDQIIGLLRSWKGEAPDVEVLEWEELGDQVLVRLRQPAFDAEWFQLLTVHEGRVARMEDHPTHASATRAASREVGP